MDEAEFERAPVSGSCARCGCALGYAAAERDGAWHCCGPCAGSDRCECGCKPEYARAREMDLYVPTRRMFASREPDGLKRPSGSGHRLRAFPFADPRRGR